MEEEQYKLKVLDKLDKISRSIHGLSATFERIADRRDHPIVDISEDWSKKNEKQQKAEREEKSVVALQEQNKIQKNELFVTRIIALLTFIGLLISWYYNWKGSHQNDFLQERVIKLEQQINSN